ncbi:MAG: vanadium-dependent haloperoxidase [Saprospiraceae bacterium]
MRKTAPLASLLLLSVLVPVSCNKDEPAPPQEIRIFNHKTADYEGGWAHEWMQTCYQLIRDNDLEAPHAARIYGYLGLCVWESVCHGIPDAKSLEGQINEYPQAPAIDPYKEYDWVIVLARAMEMVIPALVDNLSDAQRSQIEALADQHENLRMQTGLSQYVLLDSRSLGERVGQRLVDRARADGRDIIRNIDPVLPLRDATHRWYWAPAQPGQSAVEPLWGAVHPFVVADNQLCESEGPLPYSESTNSAFYAEALEVRNIPVTPANIAMAYHWEDGPGRTGTAPGHWMSIARQILKAQDRNLAECAKTYCLLGLAASDTYSTCWSMKYKFYLLRPATYINELIAPGWKPLLFTPASPDHISASAAIGGAGATILVSLLGDVAFNDKTHQGSPLYTPSGGPFLLSERAFASISQAGEEAAESRVVGGVAFRRAKDQGLTTGKCVAEQVLGSLDLGF